MLNKQVADAKKKGATILAGGKRARVAGGSGAKGLDRGNYYQPTVITDVDHSMAVMRDESFGPIIGIQSVQDDEEALVLMNDTSYGLTEQVKQELQYGSAIFKAHPRWPVIDVTGRAIEETAVIILESLKERDEAAKNARAAIV